MNRFDANLVGPSGTGILPVSFNYFYNSANQRTRATLADAVTGSTNTTLLARSGAARNIGATHARGRSNNVEYGFDDIGNRKNEAAAMKTAGICVPPITARTP